MSASIPAVTSLRDLFYFFFALSPFASGPLSRPLTARNRVCRRRYPRTNPPRDTQRHSPTVPLRETKMVTASAFCVFEEIDPMYPSAIIYASVTLSVISFACNFTTRQATRIFILEKFVSNILTRIVKNYLENLLF